MTSSDCSGGVLAALDFDADRLARYSRNVLLDAVGGVGQKKLWNARVLVVGAGGLGSPAALYLAAAGIGTLGIADADVVDLSNLQRQVLHFTPDVGRPKVDSAREKITALNPDVKVQPHREFVNAENARSIIADYDFVIDGTDSFAAKFLINDACVLAGKPFSHGGVTGFRGQTMTVNPGRSACYRCVFGAPPPPAAVPTCREAGVLGAVAGLLGTIQATEALKWVLGAGTPLTDAVLTLDALEMAFRRVVVRRNPHCPVCGRHPTILDLADSGQPSCPTWS